jgi:hypothetical protein
MLIEQQYLSINEVNVMRGTLSERGTPSGVLREGVVPCATLRGCFAIPRGRYAVRVDAVRAR